VIELTKKLVGAHSVTSSSRRRLRHRLRHRH
jgi:hypothetical protein